VTRPVAPVAVRIAEIAALIRRDARTLSRAINTGDQESATELVAHLVALADELAAPPTAP